MRSIQKEKKDFEIKLEEEFQFMRQKEVTDEQWKKAGIHHLMLGDAV